MGDDPPCRHLQWDSDFFGFRIAQATVGRLDERTLERIRHWCGAHCIDCLYFLADATDPATVARLENAGFHLVDIRVTLGARLGPPPLPTPGHSIRPCRLDDLAALRALARVSHRDSRFYCDEHFPESLCDALYETWIERSASGYADLVLVAERNDEPVGYLSCHLSASGPARIGLFAVAQSAHGLGLGKQLIVEALRWFAEHSASGVTVVTQGRNVRAQRLYQRCGFMTRSVELWYHHWPGRRTRDSG